MRKEVEVRSFLSKQEYFRLKVFLNDNADFIEKRNETTYYLNSEKDLRIQKTQADAKVWLKEGNIHDSSREEIEAEFNVSDFDEFKEIFKRLGMKPEIKWERERLIYDWDGVKCMLDHTKDYGYIIELEKLVSKNEDEVYDKLKEKLNSLDIEITPKEEFEKRYKDYKEKHLKV